MEIKETRKKKQGEIKLNKQIIKKKDGSRTEKVYAVVPKTLKEALRKYVASIAKEDRKATESEIINRALEEYLEIKANEKSVSKLETMLEKIIDEKLGRKFERHIALLSKSAKASFSSIFLQAYVLAYIFNSEDDQQFIKDKINLANKLGYQAIKSPYFEDDITRILPKDLNFKNLI